jgi:hypothetical protein
VAWSALIQINGPSFRYFFGAREKARSILESLISVGIGGIQGYLAPLFNGEIADLPFETRCLIVKADPAQLLDQARPVTRQWLQMAGNFIRCKKSQVSSSGIILLTRSPPATIQLLFST